MRVAEECWSPGMSRATKFNPSLAAVVIIFPVKARITFVVIIVVVRALDISTRVPAAADRVVGFPVRVVGTAAPRVTAVPSLTLSPRGSRRRRIAASGRSAQLPRVALDFAFVHARLIFAVLATLVVWAKPAHSSRRRVRRACALPLLLTQIRLVRDTVLVKVAFILRRRHARHNHRRKRQRQRQRRRRP